MLCKACDKYLELLRGKGDNSLISDERIMSEKPPVHYHVQDDQDHDQNGYDVVMIKADIKDIEIYCYERETKMFNQNEIYNIFNQQQIQVQLQQMQQQYHSQQMWKVSDCAKKLDDFLKSAEGIDVQYQQLAFAECCAVLGRHMQK